MPSEVERLTPAGRRVRVVVTLVGAALLLAGTLWGLDDHFPFGPFRMYATTDQINAPVRDTRVEARDAAGAVHQLDDRNTGFRRAEVEGQLDRFKRDPKLLGVLARAYGRRHPDAPPIVRIDIVVRWHELRDGRPTGAYREEVELTWTAEGQR